MRTIRILFAIFIAGIFTFTFNSCEPDNPDDGDPANAREKFIGTWTCVEASQLTYTVVVEADPANETNVFLNNFHSLGSAEKAIGVIAGSSVSIDQQQMCNGDYTVKGNGLMEANQKSIAFSYTVKTGIDTDTITATYTKQ